MKNRLLSFSLSIFLFSANIFSSEVYFSPNGGVTDQIIKRINLTKSTLDVAVYSFTSGEIADALASAARRGVKVRLIRDKIESTNKNDENAFLIKSGILIQIRKGKSRGIMHDKFAVFDGKEIFTGSFNWTGNAEKFNYENALFTDEKAVVDAYKTQFEKIWASPLLSITTINHSR